MAGFFHFGYKMHKIFKDTKEEKKLIIDKNGSFCYIKRKGLRVIFTTSLYSYIHNMIFFHLQEIYDYGTFFNTDRWGTWELYYI